MRSVIVIFALAGCGGGGSTKPVEPEPAPTTTCFTAANNIGVVMDDAAHKDELARAVDESCTTEGWSAEVITCFSDARSNDDLAACDEHLTKPQRDALLDRMMAIYSTSDGEPKSEEGVTGEISFYESTGATECDELVQRTVCMYRKMPGVSEDMFAMFSDGIRGWRTALDNDATRQATIDACKMSLDAGKEGFDSVGCTADVQYSGHPVCDELITKTRCMWDQQGAAISADMRKMFNDAIPAWREALANDALYQATVDACQMSLDAGVDGFAALGC